MKLFSRILGKTDAPDAAPEPGPIPGPVVLAAPLAGRVVALEAVPDPVFAGKVLGDGFAIDPAEDLLLAPFDGRVASLPASGHAVTLRARNGAEVLLHIGIDTVGLNGQGFAPQVREGDAVRQGQPLIRFDRAAIAPRVPSMLIPVILTSEGFGLSQPNPGPVAAGAPLSQLSPQDTAAAPAAPAGEAISREAVLADPFGLHARPAGTIAQRAKEAPVAIRIGLGERQVDARSPVALMTLGARQGDRLVITAEGAEGQPALDAIAAFLEQPVAASAARAPTPLARPIETLPPHAPGTEITLTATAAVPGIGIGRALRLVQAALHVAETAADPAAETVALYTALNQTRHDLESEIARAGSAASAQSEILAAHLSFLNDSALRDAAEALIRQGKSAGFGWKTALDAQIAALRALGNPVLAERASDLQDVQRRVLVALSGTADQAVTLTGPTVVLAEDLLPSQFAGLDPEHLAGLCLAASGPTAHIAILAAARGIPTVVAAGPEALRIADGEPVILDGETGRLRVNPPEPELAAGRARAESRRQRRADSQMQAQAPCVMADGTRIEVVANLGTLDDVAPALAAGAEGCGLLRSEFLYLDRDSAPTEDEQFAQYQAIVDAMQSRPVIIRTLDAGADKDVPYVRLPADENPALGLRGIRMSLWQPELLRDQIRAILRLRGAVKLLLPMIATLDDLRRVRAVIAAETAALGRAAPIELGVMVEVPSVALLAARFAAEVDFFSVGTNDLTQYALAMDRCNPRLAPQLDPFHPAVLRLIGLTGQGAQQRRRWVGVCGNLASQPLAAPVLIGLGVTELSATAAAIPEIKALVRGLDMARCRQVAAEVQELGTAAEVRAHLEKAFPGH